MVVSPAKALQEKDLTMIALGRITGLLWRRAWVQPVASQARPAGTYDPDPGPARSLRIRETAVVAQANAAGRVQPLPSPRAQIKIKVGPDRGWGSAQGSVPPDQAHHLITTFGVLGVAGMGIAGAVLTLRISAGLSGAAFAELAVALVAMVLIVACSLGRARRQEQGRERSHVPSAPGASGRPDKSNPAA